MKHMTWFSEVHNQELGAAAGNAYKTTRLPWGHWTTLSRRNHHGATKGVREVPNRESELHLCDTLPAHVFKACR